MTETEKTAGKTATVNEKVNATEQVASMETPKEMLARLFDECQGFEIYTLGDRNWFDNCADNYTFYSDSFRDIPFSEDGYVEVDCRYEVVGKEEYSHFTYDGWCLEENDKVLIVTLNQEDIDENQIVRECVMEFAKKLEEEEANPNTYGFLRYDFGDEYLTDRDKNQITTILKDWFEYVEVKIEDGVVVAY